jgi:hypothetical protein
MKVKMQIRAWVDLTPALAVLSEVSQVTEADVSLVFVVSYHGVEIHCTEAAEVTELVRLILKEFIASPVTVNAVDPVDESDHELSTRESTSSSLAVPPDTNKDSK